MQLGMDKAYITYIAVKYLFSHSISQKWSANQHNFKVGK